MTSARAAAETLVYEVLSGGIAGAGVFQDVPDDAPLPVVIIGEMTSAPFAAALDPDRRITLTIVTLTEGDERAPCTDLQDEIEALLGGRSFERAGWNLHVSIATSGAGLSDDGSGYVGSLALQILAFRD